MPSEEKAAGWVTKPPARRRGAASQSSSAPGPGLAKTAILPCALASAAPRSTRPRSSLRMLSTPSVFCPSTATGPPSATAAAASAISERASALARGTQTTAAA